MDSDPLLGSGGVGSEGSNDVYTCNVQLLGPQKCLDQANDFLLNSIPLDGWSHEQYVSGCGSDGNSESISFPIYAGDMWLFVPFCMPLSAPRGFCGYGCDKVGPLPPIDPSSDGFFSNSDSWYCNYGCEKGVNNPYVEPMSQCERTATKAAIAAAAVTAPITRIFGGALIVSATGTAAGTVAGGLVSCSR